MIGKRTAIWKREEYSYESEERDIPYVISYMHEDGQIRPAMIVVPGGAYRQVSSSEGDIVARTFYRAGYNALVLTYSVNPTSEGEPLHLQPLRDLARTVRTLLCETVPDRSGESGCMRIFGRRALMRKSRSSFSGYKRRKFSS
mgnify:CR=1 FL=1